MGDLREIEKSLKQQDELKFDIGKTRYSLVPPNALNKIAEVLTFGANKYEANSWRLIEDKDRYLDALIRHLEAVRMGEDIDKDSGIYHYAHVAVNAMFLLEFKMEESK